MLVVADVRSSADTILRPYSRIGDVLFGGSDASLQVRLDVAAQLDLSRCRHIEAHVQFAERDLARSDGWGSFGGLGRWVAWPLSRSLGRSSRQMLLPAAIRVKVALCACW